MYAKQENERNVFMDKLNGIIMDMNNDVQLNENNNYKYLNEWSKKMLCMNVRIYGE